jgi:multicomponent Na+:H+ antiporter subunit D
VSAVLGSVVLLPLLGALLCGVLPRRHGAAVALVTASLTTGLVAALNLRVLDGGPVEVLSAGYAPPLGIALVADGLSAAFLMMTAVVGLLLTVYATGDETARGGTMFWALWLALWSSLNAVYLSGDLFNTYVALELMGLSAVGLVALAGRPALPAALRYLVVAVLGSLAYLLGVALVYGELGTLDLRQVGAAAGPQTALAVALALMTVGMALKSALWPLHGWLPGAHGGAPAAVSPALSALVIKASVYVAVRLWSTTLPGVGGAAAAQLLGALGAAAVVWGTLLALRQQRLKLVVAYSTVAQVGYFFLVFPLALGGDVDPAAARDGWAGALLVALAHGLAKASIVHGRRRAGAGVRHRPAVGPGRRRHPPTDRGGRAGTGRRQPRRAAAVGRLRGQVPGAAVEPGVRPMVVGGARAGRRAVHRGLRRAGAAGAVRRRLPGRQRARRAAPGAPADGRRRDGAGAARGRRRAARARAGAPAGRRLAVRGCRVIQTADPVASPVPWLLLLTSFVPAVIIFLLREEQIRTRTVLNLSGALLKVVGVGLLVAPVLDGRRFEWRSELLPGLDLVLRVEPLSLLFMGLSAVLWLVTTVYAIGYLESAPHRTRFFGFFSLCVTASVGIALSGNLITFLVFYELLTLSTYPLVAHRGTPAAIAGARTYLTYTLGRAVALLLGVAVLQAAGALEFTPRGAPEVAELAERSPVTARLAFALLIVGLGVKAALVPLHGWLPRAMVAPAPVSALLHAVAVVKAGAFGVVRVVQDVFGVRLADELGLLLPLGVAACVTILYGSVMALRQDDLKKRLAYSTVSQVSYVTLGTALVGVTATTGGLVHLVNQGLMKITLFFCAGLLAETLGISRISQMAGVGRRMPLTTAAFTVAALGMIGLPPFAGFVSKWYLGLGALEAGRPEVLAVLAASSALNAAYFLPVVYVAWFRAPDPDAGWDERALRQRHRVEAPVSLLAPAVVTAALALLAGLLAVSPVSPLELAGRIAEGSYAQQ